MWKSLLLVNLEACRFIASNFTIKWTPSQVFFDSILSSPHATPSSTFWLKNPPPHPHVPPPIFATLVENPNMQTMHKINLCSYFKCYISWITLSYHILSTSWYRFLALFWGQNITWVSSNLRVLTFYKSVMDCPNW